MLKGAAASDPDVADLPSSLLRGNLSPRIAGFHPR